MRTILLAALTAGTLSAGTLSAGATTAGATTAKATTARAGTPSAEVTTAAGVAGVATARVTRCAFAPNKVEYADDAARATKQHAMYCRYGLIGRTGAWTAKGRTWIDLRNGDTPAARTAKEVTRRLALYRRQGFWNPDKIEYADDARVALGQFKRWFAQGYIAPDGGWTKRGAARFS